MFPYINITAVKGVGATINKMAKYRKKRKAYRGRNRSNSGALFFFIAIVLVGAMVSVYQVALGNMVPFLISGAVIGILLTFGIAYLIRFRMKQKQEEEYMQIQTIEQFQKMDPFEFERYVGWVFDKLGFKTKVTQEAGDHGLDIITSKDQGNYVVQVKRYKTEKLIGEEEVRNFYGSFVDTGAERGYFVTTSDYSKPAQEWAKNRPIELINGRELAKIVIGFES